MASQPNPFADLIPSAPTSPMAPAQPRAIPRVIQGPPREPPPQTAAQMEGERLRNEATRRSLENEGVPSGYRRTATGNLEAIPGGPADTTAHPQGRSTRQLPNQQIQRLTDGATSLSNLERARDTFQDNYGGNLFGGIENTLQGVNSHIGTPGQNQFWSDIAATDNVARNALFGASLTEGEKSAWEATTIRPSMDPAIIRQNLTRRIEIARNALGRLARTNAANGFNREAIEASLDQYSDLLRQGTAEGGADQVSNSALQVGMAGGATGEGDPNFAQHLQGTGAGTPERFRMLEMYHNAQNNGQAQIRIGLGVNPSEDDFIDQFGVTEAQGRQLEEEYQRELPNQQARQRREQFATEHPVIAGADTFVRSAANAMTLGLADRFAGTMSGTGPETEHAITASDWENRPITSLGGTLAGGYVLPLGSTLPRQIGAGAAYGGGYGFNSADGSFENRLYSGVLGAGVGGTAASLVGGAMRAYRGGGGPSSGVTQLAEAAGRQGVDILPADAGGAMLGRLTGGTRQTIFGSGPIASAADRSAAQAGGRLGEVAREAGTPLRQEALGEVAQRGAQRFIDQSGDVGRSLYREADDLSHDVVAQAPTAFRNINAQLRELAPTAATEGELVPALQRFRSVIADESGLRPLGVQALRRLRTTISSEARSEGLRGTDYKRRAGAVLDDLRNDIASRLSPEARQSFLRADRQWAQRLDVIDNVMAPIIGREGERSAEQVATRLQNMSTGDSANFRRLLSSLPPEESGIIRGSIIQNLGRASSGTQGAAGNTFSLSTFLTNWDKLPERSRNLLFRGESRAVAEDLATIAEHARATARYGNTSGTGGASNVSQAIQHVSGYAAFGTLGMTAIAENLTGRLLASPRFARWLARPPRTAPQALTALRRIATAEPGLTYNINNIIAAVGRAANDNVSTVTHAAASGDRPDANRE